ncbi:hypothetical protein E3V88_06830, partial [Streptococcus pseudopneumoniae]
MFEFDADVGGLELMAFDFHDPSGDIVMWDGSSRVFRYNPATDALTDVTPPSGLLPTTIEQRIYSKWRYIAAVDTFVGIDDPRNGVWVYRLPEAGGLPPEAPPQPQPEPVPAPPTPAPEPTPEPEPAPQP